MFYSIWNIIDRLIPILKRISEFNLYRHKTTENNFFNEITDKNITICRRFHKVYVLFNLKQNWPTYSDFCVNWEHIFTSFSLRYRWAILHQNHKKLLAGDREGFSLPYFFSHLFLSARYQPFQSSWRRGLFSPAIPTFYTHNPLKGIVSASSNLLGKYKPFLKLKYL